jgi:hypothetical protein
VGQRVHAAGKNVGQAAKQIDLARRCRQERMPISGKENQSYEERQSEASNEPHVQIPHI